MTSMGGACSAQRQRALWQQDALNHVSRQNITLSSIEVLRGSNLCHRQCFVNLFLSLFALVHELTGRNGSRRSCCYEATLSSNGAALSCFRGAYDIFLSQNIKRQSLKRSSDLTLSFDDRFPMDPSNIYIPLKTIISQTAIILAPRKVLSIFVSIRFVGRYHTLMGSSPEDCPKMLSTKSSSLL